MTNNEPMIQLSQSDYLRLLTGVGEYRDDLFDQDMALDDFKKTYEDESDFELERKRAIMRTRILTNHKKEESKQKYEILTKIIKANMSRRHAFERQKETAQWFRMFASLLIGAILGYITGQLHM